jgi:hypothetical protein
MKKKINLTFRYNAIQVKVCAVTINRLICVPKRYVSNLAQFLAIFNTKHLATDAQIQNLILRRNTPDV